MRTLTTLIRLWHKRPSLNTIGRYSLIFLFGNFFLQLALAFLPQVIGHAHALSFNPDLSGRTIELPEESLDLDKLSKAVAVAETGGCKDGTAKKRNNCHGIMCWPQGKRTPCYFKSQAESHKRFKEIWAKSYKRFPDYNLAKKYTGNDHTETWLRNVTIAYNQ